MSELAAWRARLAGRTKRQLIEAMIVRSPHAGATAKLVYALEVLPLWLLLRACEHPTRIWILDRGERPSSAAILDDATRRKRWHRGRFALDDCEGLTELVGETIAIVVSWRTSLVIRHEFAHAATTFFSPGTRARFDLLYQDALAADRFTEDLARESLGEYVACALSAQFFSDLRADLEATDPPLDELCAALLAEAEAISAQLVEPVAEGAERV